MSDIFIFMNWETAWFSSSVVFIKSLFDVTSIYYLNHIILAIFFTLQMKPHRKPPYPIPPPPPTNTAQSSRAEGAEYLKDSISYVLFAQRWPCRVHADGPLLPFKVLASLPI